MDILGWIIFYYLYYYYLSLSDAKKKTMIKIFESHMKFLPLQDHSISGVNDSLKYLEQSDRTFVPVVCKSYINITIVVTLT